MKALVKTSLGVGCLELIDVPEPECGPWQVKIEVEYAGICGTDIHILRDEYVYYPPVTLGHEFSGTVRETGRGVKNVKPGDRVTVLPSVAVTCGRCAYCRTGKYCFCPERRGMGHGVDGSFTRYCVVREDMVYRLADTIDPVAAALSEPFACCVQAVNEIAGLLPGETVLVSGPGPIGLITLQLVQLRGAAAIACGTSGDEKRLSAAVNLGARAVDVDKQDLQAAVRDLSGASGADVVFECAGTGASIAQCLDVLKAEGRFIQVGICGGPVEVDFRQIVFKQLRVFGSVGHTRATWNETLKLLEQEKVKLRPLVSEVIPLSWWEEAFEKAQDKRYIKIILDPSK